MVNVGVAVATSAWFLASAAERDALAIVDLIGASAAARLALERRQAPDEREVQAAWLKWYREALDSVRTLPVTGPSSQVDARVAQSIAASTRGWQ